MIARVGDDLALLRFANDIDLARAISILETEWDEGGGRRPKSVEVEVGGDGTFAQRLAHFYRSLESAGCGKGPAKIR